MNSYPLLRWYRAGAVIARRSGKPIIVDTFLDDVAALAERLPAGAYMVNLCNDRYRFVVGFAAALRRGKVNLLPPHGARNLLDRLRDDYPDLFCLIDEPHPEAGCTVFEYSVIDDRRRTAYETPIIAADQQAAVLFTSGSTGRPRPHPRTWGDLVTSTRAAGDRLGIAGLGRGTTLIGTVPHQHSYGLESLVMLSLQHGLVLDTARPLFAADIHAHLAAAPRPRVLVTSPVHLRMLLAEVQSPPPVDLVLSATAPLPVGLAREAEDRFTPVLREIYGCSEAGQIATRRTALTEQWRCLEGIVLRRDEAGTYASGIPIAEETALPDVIELIDAARFLLHGRIADMINVGGKRASLVDLNYQLNSIDGVVDGAFVVPEGQEIDAVNRLVAFVVAPGLDAEFILAQLRQRVDAAFLPRPICLVSSLPRNALGKLPREEINRMIADASRR